MRRLLLIATTMVGLGSAAAHADLLFTGTGTAADGDAIAASADFSYDGPTHKLTIVLTNLAKPTAQGSVLTNLGFQVAPATATALPSASGVIALTSGSSLVSGTTVDVLDPLGTEWAYVAGVGGGAASSGFNVGAVAGGHGNLCGGTPCTGDALDGAAFGLVGTGTDLTPSGLKPANTYVENSVTITLTLPSTSTFAITDITSVDFQYGTAPGEGDITDSHCQTGSDCVPTLHSVVPEPATLAVLGMGLLGLSLVRRRR
jgi:hypothetical protein